MFWFKTPDHRRKATQIRDSDDKDVEYKGHFCSESALFLLLVVCVSGLLRGYGGVGLGCGTLVRVCVLLRKPKYDYTFQQSDSDICYVDSNTYDPPDQAYKTW